MVNSDLWTVENSDLIKVFLTMCAGADEKGFYRGGVAALSRQCWLSESKVGKLVNEMSKPDKFGRVRVESVGGALQIQRCQHYVELAEMMNGLGS